MPKYLCLNCMNDKGVPGKPFTGDMPVCECGVDGRKPEFAQYVIRLCTIHFDPPHAILKGRGTNHCACHGKFIVGSPIPDDPRAINATGDPRVVNCDDCKKTPVWQKAMTEMGEYFLAVDPPLVPSPETTA